MAWKIDHFESALDGTIHVTALRWEDGTSKTPYQLLTAVRIPPAGPGRNVAVARLKAVGEEMRNKPQRPDLTGIEALLNAGK